MMSASIMMTISLSKVLESKYLLSFVYELYHIQMFMVKKRNRGLR